MVRKFTHRLCQRGYSRALIDSIASRVSYSNRQQYLTGSKGSANTGQTVMVMPYAQLVPELRLPQMLREQYETLGEALHVELPQRPIVAYTKNRNLGSLLVKASH